ncbi:hypothetical protein VP1G_10738 [Cytospora mali]|uniref:Uncharacterized protein n=1 Tax=Cytospora mali TaxID=578113 RepID=A0A194UUH5_CYTMA|nr:hypothetical protein VP1G_10738 [Valsa mali var. pyri (nom. inval.)]
MYHQSAALFALEFALALDVESAVDVPFVAVPVTVVTAEPVAEESAEDAAVEEAVLVEEY